METILISTCCREEVKLHHAGDESAYQCMGCEMRCEVEEVCEICSGAGVVIEGDVERRCGCVVKELEVDY